MQKIITHLWFDNEAQEAVDLYTSIFADSKILTTEYLNAPGEGNEGSVMAIEFQLAGQEFIAINGGTYFTFTPAMSLYINCETQLEVDTIWDTLVLEGEPGECGWLTDKYGISWQVVPTVLRKLLTDADPVKRDAVSTAMFKMKKLEITELQKAYDNA
ncbi:MAG: VOC family protein [Carnobacterium sp.]|uniref:VOC family protein n=1 Tax=Carnobacterium sp. TaxID=48221 RepID=UPI002FCA05B7